MNIIKNENKLLISAKDVHKQLGIKKAFPTWIKTSLQRAYLEINKDYIPSKEKSSGGRPTIDYLLVRDAVLTIIVMSGGQFARELRKEVIELYNQHETGLAFTHPQIEALMDLSKAMTLVSIQKDVEKRHFNIYNDKYTWYQHRAALLGYSTPDVIEAMRKVNKKHHSIRASLVQLDANELIRTGVIDFFMALGKTQEYAVNVGNLCKSISEKAEYGNTIWDDTKENPLQINSGEVTDRKILFDKTKSIE